MKKLLAVLALFSFAVAVTAVDGTSGDIGYHNIAGNHCADDNGGVCDQNQGNQKTLAVGDSGGPLVDGGLIAKVDRDKPAVT